MERKGDLESFDRARDEYRKNLQNHPNRHEVAKRLYVADDVIVYVRNRHPRSTFTEIDPSNIKYYPYCSIDEIKNIERMETSDDYLLKLRADAIANTPRSIRIFLSRHRKSSENWSLSKYYANPAFSKYMERLTPEHASECKKIPAGFAFLKEPNGACIKTKLGNIIVISETLEYFLFFMNIFIFAKIWDIPDRDRISSFVIATKTMLRTEPLDFDLDPRGTLPSAVEEQCWNMVRAQINFIIGHEYAHQILGHLGEGANGFDTFSMLGSAALPEMESKYYTPRQSQELEADIGSILHAKYSDEETATNLDAATIFFIGLDIFYTVDAYINPPRNQIKTHPDPIDRLWSLRKKVHQARPGSKKYSYPEKDVTSLLKLMAAFKEHLVKKFLPVEIELLEDFQSVYLPSFRQKKLHDRFDY